MSGQSDIDHPLCEECTDTLLDQLDHQLKVTTDEFNDYSKEFLDKTDSSKNEDTESLSKELEDLKLEESQLIQVLMERCLEYSLAIILPCPLSFPSLCNLSSPSFSCLYFPLAFTLILLLSFKLAPLSSFTLHPCPSLFLFPLTVLTHCCLSFTHFFSSSCTHLYAYLTLSLYSYPSFSCISPFSTSPFTLSWFFLALLTLLHPCTLSPISSRQIFFPQCKAKTKFEQYNWLAKKFTMKKLDRFLLFVGLCK